MAKQDFQKLKGIIAKYEAMDQIDDASPYIEELCWHIEMKYNPQYGDDKICRCGHPYYQHFDTDEDMDNIGCKYCGCMAFFEKTD